MSAGKIRKVGELLFGSRWQTELARALGPYRIGTTSIPVSDRIVRRWAAAEAPVPRWVWQGAVELLEQHAAKALSYARHLTMLLGKGGDFPSGDTDEPDEAVVVVGAMALPHVVVPVAGLAVRDQPALELVVDGSMLPDGARRMEGPVVMHVLAQARHDGKTIYLAVLASGAGDEPFYAAMPGGSAALREIRSRS